MAKRRLPPVPRPNLIDRVVAVVAPGMAVNRLQNRWQFEALTGGYKGARRDRRPTKNMNRREGSADSALLPDLPTLRGASQELIRNNPLAAGAINTKVTSVIGTGLKVRPEPDGEFLGLSNDQAEQVSRDLLRAYSLATDTFEIDITRRQRFIELQDLIYRATKESGDVLVLKHSIKRPGSSFTYKLQVVEAGRLSNPNFKRDSYTLAGGIEVDKNGAPVAYHVSNQVDPTKGSLSSTWVSIPAFSDGGWPLVLHIADRKRPDQTRGIPDLAGVIEPLKQLSDYTDGELSSAVIASFFTVFVKTEDDTGLKLPSETEDVGSSTDSTDILGPASVFQMGREDDIEIANPGRPNDSFDPFVQAVLRQIGVALEIPFEILIQHFTASYSAARAALLSFWKYVRRERVWFVARLCQPVYEDIIVEAVNLGILNLPGFKQSAAVRQAYLRTSWYGDAMPAIDPKKENDANAIAVDRGWKTDAEVTAESTGGDWDRKIKRRKKEIAAAKDAGLPASAPRMIGQNNGPAPAAPIDGEDAEPETLPDKREDETETDG